MTQFTPNYVFMHCKCELGRFFFRKVDLQVCVWTNFTFLNADLLCSKLKQKNKTKQNHPVHTSSAFKRKLSVTNVTIE